MNHLARILLYRRTPRGAVLAGLLVVPGSGTESLVHVFHNESNPGSAVVVADFDLDGKSDFAATSLRNQIGIWQNRLGEPPTFLFGPPTRFWTGQLRLNVFGTPGETVALEETESLSEWFSNSQVTLRAGGQASLDVTSTTNAAGFFRLRQLP
jgi:hypothetical protein